MVKRKCLKCEAEFDKKSHYDRHINRKYDCKANTNLINSENDDFEEIQNNPKYSISKVTL